MRLIQKLKRGAEQPAGAASLLDDADAVRVDVFKHAVFVVSDDGVRIGEVLHRLSELTGMVTAYDAFTQAATAPETLRDKGMVRALAPHIPKNTDGAPLAIPLTFSMMHVFGVDATARYAHPMPIVLKRLAEQRRPILHLIDSDMTRVAFGSLAQDAGVAEDTSVFRLEPSAVATRVRNHEARAATMERLLGALDTKVEQIDLDALRADDWRAEMQRALIAVSRYAEIPEDAGPVKTGSRLVSRISNLDEIRLELRRQRRMRA